MENKFIWKILEEGKIISLAIRDCWKAMQSECVHVCQADSGKRVAVDQLEDGTSQRNAIGSPSQRDFSRPRVCRNGLALTLSVINYVLCEPKLCFGIDAKMSDMTKSLLPLGLTLKKKTKNTM